MNIYVLDMIGVFAFAFFGAHIALRQQLGLWGIIVCAFLTALGGGTIRELLLQHPPVYFHAYEYLIVVLIGALAGVVLQPKFLLCKPYLQIADAIGLAAFAYIGTHAAAQASLGLPIYFMFALLTALGGGVLSETLAGQRPGIFLDPRPAAPVLVVALGYWLLDTQATHPLAQATLLCTGFGVQLLLVHAARFQQLITQAPGRKTGAREI